MKEYENYIENSEIVQLAILAATHRYFYDKCFDDKNKYREPRLKDDSETEKVNAIYKALWCKYPDWRMKIKKHMDRYLVNDAWVKSLEVTNKPEIDFSQLILIHFKETPKP
jgi:hypothetical protein